MIATGSNMQELRLSRKRKMLNTAEQETLKYMNLHKIILLGRNHASLWSKREKFRSVTGFRIRQEEEPESASEWK